MAPDQVRHSPDQVCHFDTNVNCKVNGRYSV